MKTNAEWHAQVKGMLKAELERRNVSYQRLARDEHIRHSCERRE